MLENKSLFTKGQWGEKGLTVIEHMSFGGEENVPYYDYGSRQTTVYTFSKLTEPYSKNWRILCEIIPQLEKTLYVINQHAFQRIISVKIFYLVKK